MANLASMQAEMKVLRAVYAASLPEKIKEIEHAWQQLLTKDWNEANLRNMHRMVHSLTGSGATFGFAQLSDVARQLEQDLKQLAQAKMAPNEERLARIRVLLSELHQVTLHRGASDQSLEQAANESGGLVAEHESASSRYWSPVSATRIFLVEDEPALAELLRIQLRYFGYDVTVFGTLADFCLAMRSRPDVVVLMDVTFPEAEQGGIKAMQQIQRLRDIPAPVIFITSHDDFATRLEAARAGGIAYLPKPVNIDQLIGKLDAMTSPLSPVPYRILIVDDSKALTSYYSNVLEQAGMVVKAVNNPLEIMEPLLEFSPDLILVDLYMAGCNGMELAKVIRQFESFVSIPIVFLSAEDDLDKQFSAMNLGGDDFLTKPIEPKHLVFSVSNRVRRSLLLRSFMVRDNLTKLLNHTAITDQLVRETARAKRQGAPFAFAMIDIDQFKTINDTYGHPVGDQVIKSLSLLLRQRLRDNDSVGRYGGEEFAVILSGTDGASAVKVLDSIRHDFSQLRHLSDRTEFSVTFSCGVADGLAFADATALCDAADRALDQAKQGGRNRTVLAEAEQRPV